MSDRAEERAVADALRALVHQDEHAIPGVPPITCIEHDRVGILLPPRNVAVLMGTRKHGHVESARRKRSRCNTKFRYDTTSRVNKAFKSAESVKESSRSSKQPRTVEALMLSDTMYLKDPETYIVYSTDRDSAGDLVAVGTWDGEQILRPAPAHFQKEEKAAVLALSNAAEPCPVTHRRGTLQSLNFHVADPADHCETCVESYRDSAADADVQDVLKGLCEELGKEASELRIYDPYYCTGTTSKLLASFGYTNVHNKNEDFYEQIATRSVPEYDILVTNPPFSADHVDKLIEHVRRSALPWALLMPTYVAKKDFYCKMVSDSDHKPFYIVPKKRYVFFTPKGVNRGNKRFNKRGRTSPYVTMWFVQAGAANMRVLSAQKKGRSQHGSKTRTYTDSQSLPEDLF